MSKRWISFPKAEGKYSRQAHADLPAGTYEREMGKEGFFGPTCHFHHLHPPTGWTTFEGPLHNKIPAPNRAVDNSTVWRSDYSPSFYRQQYFGEGAGVESVKTYFESQSSGRYSVDGEVTDWVKVRYNEARYGRDVCGSHVCTIAGWTLAMTSGFKSSPR